MAYPKRPRSKVPPVRFDWSLWLILGITVLWLAFHYWKEQKARPMAETTEQVALQDTQGELPSADATEALEVDNLLGLPARVQGEQVVKHLGYTLSYNEATEQPSWTAHVLTAANFAGKFSRDEADAEFLPDPDVKTGSAELQDYRGSGYDRGHLVPAGDMKLSLAAYAESFYLSNMSPQVRACNTGVWRRVEEKVRRWQKRDKVLYVVTGPVIKPGHKTIGPNRVAVPAEYYKVVLDMQPPEVKMIGFLVPNKDSKLSIEKFCVSVDKIEAETGLDFFPRLDDKVERRLEAGNDIQSWFNN